MKVEHAKSRTARIKGLWRKMRNAQSR